jgi:hypothetical protein
MHMVNKITFINLNKSVLLYYAVCMDGTPPAFHLDRGSGAGNNSWIVNLEVQFIEIEMHYTHMLLILVV